MEEQHLWYNYRSCGYGYNEDDVGGHEECYGKCYEGRHEAPSFFVSEDEVACCLHVNMEYMYLHVIMRTFVLFM